MVKKRKKKILIGIGVVVLGIIIILLVRYFSLFWGLTIDRSISVKKHESGAINVLLLGIGGGRHDGPNLTDTIILASIHPDKNRIDLVSIPRDLYAPSLKSKINKAYANGQEKNGQGILLAKAAINSITGIKPDYAVVIDFSGFVKLVDLLGGIEVDVKNTLDDYEYPVAGYENELCGHTEDGIASFSAQIATGSAKEGEIFPCRYTHLHVDAGLQEMDGELALKYVRSRHAVGVEGTDFARSARQQAVIDAVRNKVLSLGTLANPVTLVRMINILIDNINTDIKEEEYDDFIKLAQKMRDAEINNFVIDIGDAQADRHGLLINPPISEDTGYQWVLAPRLGPGNFSEIKEYVSCIIQGNECIIEEDGVTASQSASM